MIIQEQGLIGFAETAPSSWFYLFLALPVLVSGLSLIFALYKATDPIQKMQALGYAILGILFVPAILFFMQSHTGYTVHLQGQPAQVLINDALHARQHADPVALSAEDLLAYLIARETHRSQGSSKSNATLFMVTRDGLHIALLQNKSEGAIRSAHRRLQEILPLPTVSSPAGVLDLLKKIKQAGHRQAPAVACQLVFRSVLAEYRAAQDACYLRWSNRLHPMLYLGLCLPLLGLWFVWLHIKKHGFRMLGGLLAGFLILLCLLFSHLMLSTWNSRSTLVYTSSGMESRLETMLPWADRAKFLAFDEVRSVHSSTAPEETSISVYTSNPLGHGLNAQQIWTAVKNLDGFVLLCDGLSVHDRILLHQLMVRSADW